MSEPTLWGRRRADGTVRQWVPTMFPWTGLGVSANKEAMSVDLEPGEEIIPVRIVAVGGERA